VIGYKKDREGQTVMTRLNEDMLKRVATAGNGEYVLATNAGTGIEAMVQRLRGMEQSETGTYKFAGHEDRFQYFLTIGCVLIFAGLFISANGSFRSLFRTLTSIFTS
jgi:Ca-activated chloride channel homolog